MELNKGRRDFLINTVSTAGLGVLVTKTGIVQPQGVLNRLNSLENKMEQNPEIKKIKEELAKLNIFVESGISIFSPHISGENIDEQEYLVTLILIKKAISAYPKEIFLKHKFNISICKKLTSKGSRVGGVCGLFGNVILDLNLLDVNIRQNLVSTIYHELHHSFEAQNNGIVNTFTENKGLENEKIHKEYCDCNPYVGRSKYEDSSRISLDYFLSDYGSVSANEDRAVFAEFIFDKKLHLELLERISKDTASGKVLSAKYKNIIRDYYNWSDGKMDEIYWKNFLEN